MVNVLKGNEFMFCPPFYIFFLYINKSILKNQTMGYETKLIVGQVMDKLDSEDLNYFLRIAEVDLSKCCEGNFEVLINKALGKENVLKLKEVYFSDTFKIRREEASKSLSETFKNEPKKFPHVSEEDVLQIAEIAFDAAEDYESETNQDCYGEALRAVPLKLVIKAISEDVKEDGKNGFVPYRRLAMVLPMLKIMNKRFPNNSIFCILYGH